MAVPEKPKTRREQYWDGILQKIEGGSSVTVEPLEVTENGTYTAPEGKAYSPVTVDIEVPWKDARAITASGDVAILFPVDEFPYGGSLIVRITDIGGGIYDFVGISRGEASTEFISIGLDGVVYVFESDDGRLSGMTYVALRKRELDTREFPIAEFSEAKYIIVYK